MERKKIKKWGVIILLIWCLPGIMLFIGIFIDLSKEIATDLTRDGDVKALISECKFAATSHDFEKAFDNLEKLKTVIKYYEDDDQYKETYDFVFKEEAMYLCAKNDEDSHNRLTFLLTSIPVKGKALPEGTPYNNSTWHEVTDGLIEHKDYRDYVVGFNQKCDYIIDLAIANHKYNIVEYVFPLYKPVPEPLKLPKEIADVDSINKNYVLYKISYSNSDRENARNKINKAIKEGAFPGITKEIK